MSEVLPPEAKPTRQRLARRLAGPLISAVSLAAVVWWALHQPAPQLNGASSLPWLALALLIYAVVTAVRGVRWHTILHSAGVPASMADAQALIVIGYMGNTVLPARGGELLRVYFLRERTGGSWVRILGTIVAERLLDFLALLTVLLLLVFVTATGAQRATHLGLIAVVVLLALVVALAVGWWMDRTGRLHKLGGNLSSLMLATRNLLGAQGPLLVLYTAIIWLGEGGVYWGVARALGLHLDLAQACFLVVISSLAATIPAAPGYIGTYDAAIQFGLGALRVHGGRAVAFGLLARLLIFVPITVAGLIIMVFRYGKLASLRRPQRARIAATADQPATFAG